MKNKVLKLSLILIFFIMLFSNSISVYADDEISINAKAALIIETNTGKVIYEKNSKSKKYPASVTKILTAILTIENCKLDDTATASEKAISHIPSGYVIAPLFVGEKMTIKDLLYALMLKSSNDAAYVLAEHVGGSVEGFSDMMNKKAKEIGCKNTHFINPNGIHDDDHYTTAHDMYLISKYAMENKTFAKIVSTYKYTLQATNKYTKNDRVMENTNKFINPNSLYYNKSVKGIKTGTTTEAGNCLITYESKDGLNYITVVLGAETESRRFSETQKMIKYAFDNYQLTKLHKKDDVVKNIEVEKATKETKKLNLVISDDIKVIHNKKIKTEDIKPKIVLNENITAPIKKGQELGTIEYKVDGIEYKAKLLAKNDVELKTYYFEILIGIGIVAVVMIVVIKIRKRR